MFMRLTYYSSSETEFLRISAASVGYASSVSGVAPLFGNSSYVDKTDPSAGASFGLTKDWFQPGDCAPDSSVTTSWWYTATSVDNAGWTEVVIRGGPQVLHNVITGDLYAKVNTSINWVTGSVPGGLWPFRLSDGKLRESTLGCTGFVELSSCSFSCSNNNEVTI